MNRLRIVCFDFETSGLNFTTDKPIQYAAKSIELDGSTKSISGFVSYDKPLDTKIVEMTGITSEILHSEGVSYNIAMQSLIDFIGLQKDKQIDNVILIGHNILNFDMNFLELACAELGYELPVPYLIWDTAGCYKSKKLNLQRNSWESIPEYQKRGLDTYARGVYFRLSIVCEDYGITFLEQHRADSDVNATIEVFKKQAVMYSDEFKHLLEYKVPEFNVSNIL